MGVPAFFRWLSRKYPAIVVNCYEEKARYVDGNKIPVDTSKRNPNDVEFDNLYLDMNGIIHPCCHPEDKPAPKNVEEMMVAIFEYIDRLFAICRPRRLLYMAIDGVAPRAKMNQQRSRRFRSSKEAIEKIDDIARIKDELRMRGAEVLPDKPASEHFDSNCITPGTEFMFQLAECLRYYIHDRLNNDPGWQNIRVILSDANVPGEGEHKIMDFIRRQRAQPDYDPNTHHCLCGADADLIMLGLATHEPLFTIIREEFTPFKPRPCEICGQIGHEMKDCTGAAKEKSGEFDELPAQFQPSEAQFIFIRLTVLREYLYRELQMDNLPFKQDIERAIDDWVFMCFFVGNDFLPHLPSLEIREGAIDRLVRIYKNAVYKTGGYITENGYVSMPRVQLVLQDLGEMEDEIFKKRRETDLEQKRRDEQNKRRKGNFTSAVNSPPKWMLGGRFAPQALGQGHAPSPVDNARQAAAEGRVQAMSYSTKVSSDSANKNAAAELRAMLVGGGEGASDTPPSASQSSADSGSGSRKRKSDVLEEPPKEDAEPEDEVKLWEDGWRDRYYKAKFAVDAQDVDFRTKVAHAYVLGLCWVLRYYYQGCASWKWYYPYHYAPFASDFIHIADLNIDFELHTKPFQPLEQLMGVFPAASRQFLPVTWQRLMTDPESPIIDFYPSDFRVDLNGKKYAWQGVALLPFVDEIRLKKALTSVYSDLTAYEQERNSRGSDRLFVGQHSPLHAMVATVYEQDLASKENAAEINSSLCQGMRGRVWADKVAVMVGSTFKSPLPACADLENNSSLGVMFEDPLYAEDYVFPAKLLPNARTPPATLKPQDFRQNNRGEFYRPQLGFTPGSGYRDRSQADSRPLLRNVRSELNLGSRYPPPLLPPPPRPRGGYDNNQGHYGGGQGQGHYGGGQGHYGGGQGHYRGGQGQGHYGEGGHYGGGHQGQGQWGGRGGGGLRRNDTWHGDVRSGGGQGQYGGGRGSWAPPHHPRGGGPPMDSYSTGSGNYGALPPPPHHQQNAYGDHRQSYPPPPRRY